MTAIEAYCYPPNISVNVLPELSVSNVNNERKTLSHRFYPKWKTIVLNVYKHLQRSSLFYSVNRQA